jgi:hypothetical protein
LLGIFILIALGCPNIRMAGTTTSYLADQWAILILNHLSFSFK